MSLCRQGIGVVSCSRLFLVGRLEQSCKIVLLLIALLFLGHLISAAVHASPNHRAYLFKPRLP